VSQTVWVYLQPLLEVLSALTRINDASIMRFVSLSIMLVHEGRFYGFLPRCMQCRRGLVMRKLSVCPYVRPIVCPFVKRVVCDKTEERSVQIFTPYERTFSLVFREEEWLVGGDAFYLKFWVNWHLLERNCRF